MTTLPNEIIAATRRWVETLVIGLNLCPFAKRELVRGRIRFVVSEAASAVDLIPELESELNLLVEDASVGTTLLIHPNTLTDFAAYLGFLEVADGVLREKGYEGEIQIASFHPDYQFAGTDADDVSNYTNRSPHPMLHLIREDDISWAVESHPDVEGIPARNIVLMEEMGLEKLKTLTGLD